MSKERAKEYKPLSFSTTMRNPARIAAFLNCILPYEGQILTNAIIDQVAINLIRKSREQNTNKMQLLGKICLGIGVICAIPIFLVLGYILYLYIG